MRLPQPFYRLPLRFDVKRLQAEVSAITPALWAKHPNEIEGNSSVRLISVDGAENDAVNGAMRATPQLENSPYIRQILASFGVVWSRSRLMRLAPGAQVPQHADINYHWFSRVRLHIPIVTSPEVRFYCDPQDVHMAAGEAWIFDNWRLHRVINPSPHERIHLVADTSGSAAFWQLVSSAQDQLSDRVLPFDPSRLAVLLTEQTPLSPIMNPAEMDLLVRDLRSELAAELDTSDLQARAAAYHSILESFCRDWRQLYQLYGENDSGWSEFAKLRDSLRAASRQVAEGLVMRTNRVAAHAVLEGRVLTPSLSTPLSSKPNKPSRSVSAFNRPIIIVAAPRSGSTLLFETLATSKNIATLGGEAHWLIEGIPALRVGAPGVTSNRLLEHHLSGPIAHELLQKITANLVDSTGKPIGTASNLRLLEKTPKNALRIPFFSHLFPDALFLFLWRDPRENLSSIMEAWRSGRWKTYNGLPGFDGLWSLLLPPDWSMMNGKPLEEIAAFQWDATNRIILEDLNGLPRERWMHINYREFLQHPMENVKRICAFAQVDLDDVLVERLSQPLPLSRQTHTPPSVDKWRVNQPEIERVLPMVEFTWRRLLAL